MKVSRIELLTTLSEIVGFKTGLALSSWDIEEHLEGYDDLLWGPHEEQLDVSQSRFEQLTLDLMVQLGGAPQDARVQPGTALRDKYSDDVDRLELVGRLDELFTRFLRGQVGSPTTDNPLGDFSELARAELGEDARHLIAEYCGRVVTAIHVSPWSRFRRYEYEDGTGLSDLFDNESLETAHGTFLDQRFIDFLAQNPQALDQMNWRKFEGLTGEFFQRCGHVVRLGSGRNDGNIDARIWPREANADGPPAMLVQCKRERRSVGKVVVKALWADVAHEGARSGLIVTTSTLSRGARGVCVARAYPIEAAERPTLVKWVEAMRTPLHGVFMGE